MIYKKERNQSVGKSYLIVEGFLEFLLSFGIDKADSQLRIARVGYNL